MLSFHWIILLYYLKKGGLNLRKSKQINGMPVYSLEEGQQIGTVRGLVLDPTRKQVVALAIAQKGWLKEHKYIPYKKVRSIGEDAITIDRGTAVEKGASLPEIVKLVRDKVELTGTKIVTENGTILGLSDEYLFDLLTGKLTGIEISSNLINSVIKGKASLDISYVLTIGKEVIICADEALNHVTKVDSGVSTTVKTIRDSTTQAWGSTLQLTRNLGNSLNRSLDRVRRDKQDICSEHQDCSCATNETTETSPISSTATSDEETLTIDQNNSAASTVPTPDPEDRQQLTNNNKDDGLKTNIPPAPDSPEAREEDTVAPPRN